MKKLRILDRLEPIGPLTGWSVDLWPKLDPWGPDLSSKSHKQIWNPENANLQKFWESLTNNFVESWSIGILKLGDWLVAN